MSFLFFNETIRKFKFSMWLALYFFDSTGLDKEGLCHECVKALTEETILSVEFLPQRR